MNIRSAFMTLFLLLAVAGNSFAQTLASISAPSSNRTGSLVPFLTLSLSAPATTTQTVTLTSSSPSVAFFTAGTVTTNITFSVGQSQKTVPLKFLPSTYAQDVVIRAVKGSELKLTHIGVVPSTDTIFGSLVAHSRTGQVLLNWEAVDPRISGVTYTISKFVGGSYVTLKSGWKTTYFVDRSPSALGHTYRVVPVIPGRTYTSTSANLVSGTPLNGTSVVSLGGVPVSTVSGKFNISTLGAGNRNIGTIVIDGAEYGKLRAGRNNWFGTGSQGVGTIDTQYLANGSHTLQVLLGAPGAEQATQEYSFTTSNSFRIIYSSGLSEPQAGSDAALQLSLPSNSPYTIEVLDEADAVIRSKSGSGQQIDFWWDGLDAALNDTASGRYEFRIQQGSSATSVPVYRMSSGPNFLALIGTVSGDGVTVPQEIDDANTKKYARQIRIQMDVLRGFYPYYDVAIFYDTDGSNDVVFNANLLRWMKTAKAFYYYGHSMDFPRPASPNGVGSFIQFGNAAIWPNSTIRPGSKISSNNFSVTDVVDPNNPYHFVFLDTCVSAGGGMFATVNGATQLNDAIGTANNQWKDAFESDCFVGWNGLSGSNTNDDGTDSYWFKYRKRFWFRVGGNGDWISRAFNYANGAPLPGNQIMPQDTNGSIKRLFQDGDVTLP